MFGDSVQITDGYRSWWSYIPHFIGSPGYVYAYAYGQLLALSVYQQYEQRGEELVPQYLEMLAAGGSRSPEELGRIVGDRPGRPGLLGRRPGSGGAAAAGGRRAAARAGVSLFDDLHDALHPRMHCAHEVQLGARLGGDYQVQRLVRRDDSQSPGR